jgi:hypothetical protein
MAMNTARTVVPAVTATQPLDGEYAQAFGQDYLERQRAGGTTTSVRLSHPEPAVSQYAAGLNTGYMLASEVADLLGVSATTVRRWQRRDPHQLGPTFTSCYGGHQVWLYDRAAVRRLVSAAENAAKNPERGRPRLWDPAERRERRRQHSAASYQRRRAAELAERGDHSRALSALARAESITRALERRANERAGDKTALAAMLDRANFENWSYAPSVGYSHGICRTRHRTAAAARRCRLARLDAPYAGLAKDLELDPTVLVAGLRP